MGVAGAIRQETVVAARDGDHAALCALMDASLPAVRRFATRHCPITEVEDAVQDTMYEITRRIRSLRAAPAYVAWIFRIVKNTCDRALRMMGREVPLDDRPELHAAWAQDPTAFMIDILAALEALPEHYRQVVMLRDVREMSIAEIEAELELSREAVKGRLHRARVLLRAALHG